MRVLKKPQSQLQPALLIPRPPQKSLSAARAQFRFSLTHMVPISIYPAEMELVPAARATDIWLGATESLAYSKNRRDTRKPDAADRPPPLRVVKRGHEAAASAGLGRRWRRESDGESSSFGAASSAWDTEYDGARRAGGLVYDEDNVSLGIVKHRSTRSRLGAVKKAPPGPKEVLRRCSRAMSSDAGKAGFLVFIVVTTSSVRALSLDKGLLDSRKDS